MQYARAYKCLYQRVCMYIHILYQYQWTSDKDEEDITGIYLGYNVLNM